MRGMFIEYWGKRCVTVKTTALNSIRYALLTQCKKKMLNRVNIDKCYYKKTSEGTPYWEHEEHPFTGILVCHDHRGRLTFEKECRNGFEEGWNCSFHPNGKINTEYMVVDNQIVEKTFKRWDENGKYLGSNDPEIHKDSPAEHGEK